MDEHWEIYMKTIDGAIASVQSNVGIATELEDAKAIYPTVGFVKAMLKTPKENGLLSDEEQPEISYLEDKLESSLIKFRIGKYVGRIISQGSVTFIFYLQFTYNWEDFLSFALEEFQGYDIVQGFQEDNEWNYYHHLLYPSVYEWQIIHNHKVCDSLQANGDDLKISRMIEHNFYLPDKAKSDILKDELRKDGFILQEESKDLENKIMFYRKDIPFYYDIDELTLGLIKLGEKHGAIYDGWETSIVKS
ncbi:MAG: DUF695 domain-containing protein [Sulfurovaceae bacterium]|nr:DUF695 domain-containing protein [Sulfurovaceae bacterium]